MSEPSVVHEPVHEPKEDHCCESGKKCTKSHSSSLKQTVSEQLAASGPKVFEMVVDHLVDEQLQERKGLVVKGLAKLKELQREHDGIKAAPVGFTADGCEGAKLFTKEQFDKRKKLSEDVKKLHEALENALGEKCCYEKLKNLVK